MALSNNNLIAIGINLRASVSRECRSLIGYAIPAMCDSVIDKPGIVRLLTKCQPLLCVFKVDLDNVLND